MEPCQKKPLEMSVQEKSASDRVMQPQGPILEGVGGPLEPVARKVKSPGRAVCGFCWESIDEKEGKSYCSPKHRGYAGQLKWLLALKARLVNGK